MAQTTMGWQCMDCMDVTLNTGKYRPTTCAADGCFGTSFKPLRAFKPSPNEMLHKNSQRVAVENAKAANTRTPQQQQCMDTLVEAGYQLLLLWNDSLNDCYPEYLPSFDDFLNDLMTWRDRVS